MTPDEFLAELQAGAENGYHKKLKMWVDSKSSVALFVRKLGERVE